jgi:hypothetical protein
LQGIKNLRGSQFWEKEGQEKDGNEEQAANLEQPSEGSL